MLASLAPRRKRFFLLLAALIVLVAATATVIAVVRHDSGHSSPVAAVAPTTPPGPVLLVPGYGGSTTSLQPLAARLRAAGKDVTTVSLPGGGTGDLDEQAVVLGDAARSAMTRTGAASVDVVGYSAGGVVARLWVKNHGGAGIARRVVTLGSPQHGTQLADLAMSLAPSDCPVACRQLTTSSTLLAALNRGGETPAGPLFVSIWTTADDVVTPADSARLSGAAANLTVQGVCAKNTVKHTGLPGDPVVMSMVQAELGSGALAAFTPADCAPFSAS